MASGVVRSWEFGGERRDYVRWSRDVIMSVDSVLVYDVNQARAVALASPGVPVSCCSRRRSSWSRTGDRTFNVGLSLKKLEPRCGWVTKPSIAATKQDGHGPVPTFHSMHNGTYRLHVPSMAARLAHWLRAFQHHSCKRRLREREDRAVCGLRRGWLRSRARFMRLRHQRGFAARARVGWSQHCCDRRRRIWSCVTCPAFPLELCLYSVRTSHCPLFG